MVINMNESKLCTIEQIEQFLNASALVEFSKSTDGDDAERYAHISRVLKRFDYHQRNKCERGLLLRYLRHTSGYSRPQMTRLVAQWHTNRLAGVPLRKRYTAPAAPFTRKYTSIDIELLVEMDKANEDVCGPAIVHLLKRAYNEYGDSRYERLATLSSSHLYNLRKRAGYQAQRVIFTKTRPARNAIGIRKPPRPDGRAGFVRIDSVHQGDLDGIKGVYHITCVDSVSQWQIEACVQGISEAFLLPVLESVMAQFPFELAGFHSDNGSEYINASVVRKHMGFAHIPQKHATRINAFYQQTFNPWLNLHRPCMYATEVVSPQGQDRQTLQIRGCEDTAGVFGDAMQKGVGHTKKGHHAGIFAGASKSKHRPGCGAGNATRQE